LKGDRQVISTLMKQVFSVCAAGNRWGEVGFESGGMIPGRELLNKRMGVISSEHGEKNRASNEVV